MTKHKTDAELANGSLGLMIISSVNKIIFREFSKVERNTKKAERLSERFRGQISRVAIGEPAHFQFIKTPALEKYRPL